MADKNFGVKGINFISDPGTPTISIASSTITYVGGLNLNASTVGISTDVSIGGKILSNVVVSNEYSVGIGTTILTEKLNINGNANISGVVSATGFVGSGVSLTGVLKNQSSTIDSNVYQYFLISPQTSGTISTVSSSYNYITFNPAAKYLGIGTNNPAAGLDVSGTGRFIGSVTAPSFIGTATTATNLTDAANITTGIVSTARLSGTYNISITGNVATATTATGLRTDSSINTSGIITASSFVGNLTGTATTANNVSSSININTSGIITATSFTGNLTGTATTATQLQTSRFFSVSGDVSTGSSVSFNGTQNVGLAVTLALSGVTSGTYGSSTSIPSISVNNKGIITGVTTSGITVGNGTLDLKTSGVGLSGGITTFTANQATGTAVTFTVTSNATNANTANAIVSRDASGNFYAGIITATTFSGTATTAATLTANANVSTSGIITATTFSTGISTQNIGFTTGIISGPNTIFISPYQIGISTGTVRILGNLQVDGTTYTTTQATIESSAKTIGVAVSETNDISLDGAGLGIGSVSIRKTLLWNYGSSSLKSSENFNLALGKVYKINDNEVLSSTTLANSVTSAAGLTTVGTLQQLVVSSNTSTDAVKITQLGSGNALVVEDETSPDGTAFIVSSTGSIGIGTTIPAYKLTITNNALPTTGLTNAIADFTGSVNGYTQLNIRNSLSGASASADLIATADTGSDITNYIDLGINNSSFSSDSWKINGALDGYLYTSDGSLSIGIATSNTAKYLSFFVGGLLAANEQVRINQIGVGIGTTNPTSKLDVVGDAKFTGIITASQLVSNVAQGTSPITVGSSTLVTNLNANYLNGQPDTYYTNANNLTGTISSSRLSGTYGISITGTATTLADAANITTGTISSSRLSGTYGISITGTATTANNVSSSININTSGIITASSFVGNLTGTATTANNVSSSININTSGIITASSFVGNLAGTATTANNVSSSIDINTSGIITATDFNSTSDINLKTNIHQIEDSLSKVIQIRGVTFNWRETNKSSAGVIAQEVQSVLPELVSGEETKTVNYNGIIGALIEAVKELKVENDILKEKLEVVYKKVFG